MESWELRKERGHAVLTAGSRYLSLRSDQGTQEVITMNEAIDPLGILQKAVPAAVHTTDNQVLYFERLAKSKRYE